MNSMIATVKQIQSADNLNVVTFDYAGNTLKMMSLDIHNIIVEGQKVLIGTKATSIDIIKNDTTQKRMINTIHAKVEAIKHGELLSSITLAVGRFTLESIMIREMTEDLQLCVDDAVLALINASELAILEVY